MARTPFLSLLALGLILAGCDAAEPDAGSLPNYGIVSLSAGVSGSFRGGAAFSSQSGQFRLYLYDGAEADLDVATSEYVAFFASGVPAAGTYAVVDPDSSATLNAGYARSSPNVLFVRGQTGTIEFTAVTATRVEGTFTFSGVAFVPGQTGRGTISGRFLARPATTALPPYSFVIPEG